MDIKKTKAGLRIEGSTGELLDAMLIASSMGIRNYKSMGDLIIVGSGEILEKLEKKIKTAHLIKRYRTGK